MIDFFLQYINSPFSLFFLFLNCFLSATILPLSSEIFYLTLVKLSSHSILILWLIASIGNTLGGITNLFIGRLFPHKRPNQPNKIHTLAEKWINKYGYYALLLSALPLIGDILCLLAGWQRLNTQKCCLFLFIGKAGRYAMLTLPLVF